MMKKITIKSTSKSSAVTDDVLLRETKTTRLVFRPLIIDNVKNPEASILTLELKEESEANASQRNAP